MTTEEIGSAAGSYPAGDGRFTIYLGLHISYEPLPRPSSSLPVSFSEN
jgi:hypothetical protein